jgi:hypothetical protein
MKYIITEEQSNIIRVLRRIDQDHDWIKEIVDEGMEMFLCEYDSLNDFYELLCRDSAFTYLLNYFDNEHQEGFLKLKEYIASYIKENFGEMIVKYWEDNREDC